VLHDAREDLRHAHALRELNRCLNQLLVVAPVQGHAAHPEVLEELRKDLLFDVRRRYAVRCSALLDYLQHNLLHLFVGRKELASENDDYFLGIVVCVHRVHQRDDITDGFKKGRQALPAMLADTGPQRLEHGVEGLDTVGCRGFCQRGDGEGRDRADLLLLVLQTVCDAVHKTLQVGQHGAAE
ncbi:MAG: hypothetical protein BJ554DRAFT_2901, partial [Olpidium bornovanus]